MLCFKKCFVNIFYKKIFFLPLSNAQVTISNYLIFYWTTYWLLGWAERGNMPQRTTNTILKSHLRNNAFDPFIPHVVKLAKFYCIPNNLMFWLNYTKITLNYLEKNIFRYLPILTSHRLDFVTSEFKMSANICLDDEMCSVFNRRNFSARS